MIQDPSPDYQIATVLLTPTVLFECCPYLLLGISVLQAEEKIAWEQSVLIRTSAHRAKEFTDVISISCDYLWFLEMLAQAKWFFSFIFLMLWDLLLYESSFWRRVTLLCMAFTW